jgi:ABC-type branched-subunit amino acid transport system ATPase component
MKPVLDIRNLDKHFDGVIALDDFSCTLNQSELVGIIGSNGAGKTTLFNVLTGFISPDNGYVAMHGTNLAGLSPHKRSLLGIGRTFQNLRLIRRLSVLENVLLFFKSQPGERLSNIFFRRRRCKEQESHNRDKALSLLKEVGLQEKASDPAEAMSYGQQKLLSIVCCLASDAEVLLLDEPVAGIAPEMIDKILSVVKSLPAQGKSVMLIEHNLDAVMQVSDRVVFMDAGAKISEGTPQEVRNDPKIIDAYID